MTTTRVTRTTPGTVTCARLFLAVVSLYHLAIAGFTLTHTDLLHRDLTAHHPSASPAVTDHDVHTAVTLVVAVHLPLFLLTGVLAVVLASGRPYALRPTTVSQLFGVAFSSVSTPPFDGLGFLIPAIITFQAGVIFFLWAPRRSREFFSANSKSPSAPGQTASS